jgi:uncharacterized protein (TIGR01244 family)
VAAAGSRGLQSVQTPFRRQPEDDAMNVEKPITDRITIAGQPTEADLARLRSDGYAAVVNLRDDGEPEQPLDVAAERRAAGEVGLAYHHLGVGQQPLSDPGVAEACDFIDREAATGKVLVHCRGGGRAAAITLIQQARARGWKADEAIEKGREIGLTLDPGQQLKVEQYFKSRG